MTRTMCALMVLALVATCLGPRPQRCLAGEGKADEKKAREAALKAAREFRAYMEKVAAEDDDIRTPEGKKAWDIYRKKKREFRRRLSILGEPALAALEGVGLGGGKACTHSHYWATYVLLCGKDIPDPGRQKLVDFFRKRPLPLACMAQMLEDLNRYSTSPSSWMPLDAVAPLIEKLLENREKMWQLCMSNPGWPELKLQGPDGKIYTTPGNPGEDHVIDIRGCDVAIRFLQSCYAADLGWDFLDTKEAAAAREAAVEKAKAWVAERMTRFRVKEALFTLLEKRRALKVESKDRLADACRLAASFAENRGDLWRLVEVWLAEADELARTGKEADDLTKAFLASLTNEVAVLFRRFGAKECKAPRGRNITEAERARAWLANVVKTCQKSEKSWHGRNEWEILYQRLAKRPEAARSPAR